MNEPNARLVRVLRILLVIVYEPRVWTRASLAGHFGVSERAVDLDLQLLRAAGTDVRLDSHTSPTKNPAPATPRDLIAVRMSGDRGRAMQF